MGNSPEEMCKAAEVLKRHGFEEKSKFLAGRQSRPSSICLCCYTVELPYDAHLACDIHYCPVLLW